MISASIVVLGGGNTAFSVAANLSLQGVRVTLCELPEFRQTIEPISQTGEIILDGVAQQGTAPLQLVTTNFAEALAENELILLIVPAYGHRAFAKACAPHLRQGQVVVLMPGTLGSLEFAHILRQQGTAPGVVVAEVDTAPYVCRKMSATSAQIWGVVSGLGLGVWPAKESERVRSLLEPLFPGLQMYDHVVAAGLASMNPVVHPAGVLLNAGRIEYSRGDFYFYEEGVTPSVCRLIYAVDQERRAVAKALDVELPAVDEAFHQAGFGPQGDLWATINGSRMLTQLRAPGVLGNRWLTEDVPYGLAAWAKLGEQLRVNCPIMKSVVDLNSAMMGTDFWTQARDPEQLGIAGLTKEQLLRFLNSGD